MCRCFARYEIRRCNFCDEWADLKPCGKRAKNAVKDNILIFLFYHVNVRDDNNVFPVSASSPICTLCNCNTFSCTVCVCCFENSLRSRWYCGHHTSNVDGRTKLQKLYRPSRRPLYHSGIHLSDGSRMTFNGTYTYMNVKNDGGYVYMQQSSGVIRSLYLMPVDDQYRIGYHVMDSDSTVLNSQSSTLHRLHLLSPQCENTSLNFDVPDPRVEQNFTFIGN